MRKILHIEIQNELCNAAALGAYNALQGLLPERRSELAKEYASMEKELAPFNGEMVEFVNNSTENLKRVKKWLEGQGEDVEIVPFNKYFNRKGLSGKYAAYIDGKILLNKSNPTFWKNPEARKNKFPGQWASNHNMSTIFHELGHSKFRAKKDYFYFNQKNIAAKVSKYASSKPNEFIAEYYSGRKLGKKYDKDVTAMFYEISEPIKKRTMPDHLKNIFK